MRKKRRGGGGGEGGEERRMDWGDTPTDHGSRLAASILLSTWDHKAAMPSQATYNGVEKWYEKSHKAWVLESLGVWVGAEVWKGELPVIPLTLTSRSHSKYNM